MSISKPLCFCESLYAVALSLCACQGVSITCYTLSSIVTRLNPIIYVSITHDGISLQDAERLLLRPMEKELQGIEGLKELRATASQGQASVTLEFEAGFDSDATLDDVRKRVESAKVELPMDSDEPGVDVVNVALFPVLVVTQYGTAPERTLLQLAKETRC